MHALDSPTSDPTDTHVAVATSCSKATPPLGDENLRASICLPSLVMIRRKTLLAPSTGLGDIFAVQRQRAVSGADTDTCLPES